MREDLRESFKRVAQSRLPLANQVHVLVLWEHKPELPSQYPGKQLLMPGYCEGISGLPSQYMAMWKSWASQWSGKVNLQARLSQARLGVWSCVSTHASVQLFSTMGIWIRWKHKFALIIKSNESAARVSQLCKQLQAFRLWHLNHSFRSTFCTEHDYFISVATMVLGLSTSSFDGWLFTVYKIQTETYLSRHLTHSRVSATQICSSFLWRLSQKDTCCQAGCWLWNDRRICWAHTLCLKTRHYLPITSGTTEGSVRFCWPQGVPASQLLQQTTSSFQLHFLSESKF